MTATITREQLHSELDGVIIVDALGTEAHAQQHIPGAIPLAPKEVKERAAEILPDKNASIVTYCANEACPNSAQVADQLTALGYTDVRKYKEGIQDWAEAGLPLE